MKNTPFNQALWRNAVFIKLSTALVIAAAALLAGFTFISFQRYCRNQYAPIVNLPSLQKNRNILPLLGKTPSGKAPATIHQIKRLTEDINRDEIKKKDYHIVISMQDLENDWSRTQVQTMKTVFEHYGINVTAVTDGEFSVEKQLNDYRNIAYLKSDLLITLPLDEQLCAPALQKISQNGTKLILIDAIPRGFKHAQDYNAVVMADSYANGRFAVRLLAESINKKGRIALLHWNTSMYTCDQRSLAAKAAAAEYPEIKIENVYFDAVSDVKSLTEKLLHKYSDLAGIWAVWDAPALEAVKVVRASGRKIYVTTVDLGHNAALELARGDILIGLTAQHPMHQGYALALCAVAALDNHPTPQMILVPGRIVRHDDLENAWRNIYAEKLPRDIYAVLHQQKMISQ